MFRDVKPLIENIKETVYTEFARYRGTPICVGIERDPATTELLFKLFTRHPEYLPAACRVRFQDANRVFNEIQGTGIDEFNIPYLTNLVEMNFRFIRRHNLDNGMRAVVNLVAHHPSIALALICGHPPEQGNVSPYPAPSIRLMMVGELLKRNGDPRVMQKFYDHNAHEILSHCLYTFTDMLKLLNVFKPESPHRQVVLNHLRERTDIMARMINNDGDLTAAYRTTLRYFPDLVANFFLIPKPTVGW